MSTTKPTHDCEVWGHSLLSKEMKCLDCGKPFVQYIQELREYRDKFLAGVAG